MVHVAREMQRRGFAVPLLIGGATTSAKHTAVKIAPAYNRETVHVLDASRAAGVVEQLLNPQSRPELDRRNRREQAQLVESYQQRQAVHLVPYADAVAKRFQTDWANDADRRAGVSRPPRARRFAAGTDRANTSIGRRCFMAWEMKGKYPQILLRSGKRAKRPGSCSTMPSGCSSESSASGCCGPRRVRLLAGRVRRRRHRAFHRRHRAARADPLPYAPPAMGAQGADGVPCPGRFHRPAR